MERRRIAGLAAGFLIFAMAGAACGKEVASAEEGDCIEELAFGGIEEIPTTDCDEDHVAQVVGTFDHEGGDDFPGEEEIGEEAEEECADLFEDFVGAPVEETSLTLNSINPSEESWEEADDRETICIAQAGDGSDLDQSIEDAADEFEASSGGGGDGGGGGVGGGDDTSLEDFADLVESCEGGDMADCDQLFFDTPPGSEAEAVALECGGEDPGGDHRGDCEDQFG